MNNISRIDNCVFWVTTDCDLDFIVECKCENHYDQATKICQNCYDEWHESDTDMCLSEYIHAGLYANEIGHRIYTVTNEY